MDRMSNYARTQSNTMQQQQLSGQTMEKMSTNFTRADIYAPVTTAALSRTQERIELQQLNDRFASYIQQVRLLAERNNQVDSSGILMSAKAMEVEIHNLKNMYEQELEKMRKEVESHSLEKATYQMQVNKHMQCASQLQDRLNAEMEKNGSMMEEMSNHHRKISMMELELQGVKMAASRPHADMEQMQRSFSSLTREHEALKHRYEHEQVARQEAEGKVQQIMKKLEFNGKVSAERMGELSSRVDMSASTILSLESKVRDLNKPDASVLELLKQVRETAETDLKKFQMESEEQYNRNLAALKVQADTDTKMVQRLESERNQLRGGVGELQVTIRSLQGQVANLEHQRKTLEETVAAERRLAADNVRSLEMKGREVQEMLVAKLREASTTRDVSIPLKTEIEALKALMEEEERRLQIALVSGNTTSIGEATSFMSGGYKDTTAATANAAATSTAMNAFNNSSAAMNTAVAWSSDAAHSTGMYDTSSPALSLSNIPESIRPMGMTGTSLDPMFVYPQFEDELDPQLFGYSGYSGSRPVDNSRCMYEMNPSSNRLSMDPSPPPAETSASRAKSAPDTDPKELTKVGDTQESEAERQRNLNLVRSDLGQGHDYFDKMFQDLQQDTLYHQTRPKSNSPPNVQPLSSVYRDYAVSTSSATGDVKILEVHQEGKFVRLVNKGAQDVDFGGFMIQQNVGGHPVAVFRFPPRTKLAPNSIVTVYSGSNDPRLHNPPRDFVWKEQQKWGSGPECTTILCRPNGQAVAWTTAAHRFTRDTYLDEQNGGKAREGKATEDVLGEDNLAEMNVNANASKTETVSLRREKQQPASLQSNRQVYDGNSGAQSSMMYSMSNDNGQSACPDLIPVQKTGGTGQRKYVSGVSSQQLSGSRNTGKSTGIIQGPPSLFHSPLQQELQHRYRFNNNRGGSLAVHFIS